MRNRSTRVIVGLLLLTGVATSGLKQAGLLTGTVIQDARMQFRAASPYAQMGTNGIITIPTGSDILLDWSEVSGFNSGSMICYLYASRAIDGIPAAKNDSYTIPNYGAREVNGITQDTSFTVVCDNADGYSPPFTSQTVQVKVGGPETTLSPYDHRAIQYPALPVSATFTLTSGSTTNGADNVLDIQKGSDVTLSWTSSGTQDACTLMASDLVNVTTEIPAGTLHPGNTYTGGKLSNVLNDFFIVRRTGSMTLRGVTESFSVFLSCATNIPPGGGSAQSVSLSRAVYVVPKAQCSDGLDNDGDGKTDFPSDPQCSNVNDSSENLPVSAPVTQDASQCSDGIDNDGDGLKDSADPGCAIRQGHEDDNTGMCTLKIIGQNRNLQTSDLMPPLDGIALGNDGIWFRIPVLGYTFVDTAGNATLYKWSETDTSYGSNSIVKGSDNNMWFPKDDTTMVKRSTSGVLTSYTMPLAPRAFLALGGDGNIWGLNGNKVIKVTPTGVATEYPYPFNGSNYYLQDVATGPDGSIWYSFRKGIIARLAMSGDFTQYDTGIKSLRGIGAGPDGNMWFVGMNDTTIVSAEFNYQALVGKLTPTGAITTYALPSSVPPNDVVAGADGNLWITSGDTTAEPKTTSGGIVLVRTMITRMTPNGQFTQFSVREMNANKTMPGTALGTALKGSDNKIWAMGPTLVQGYQYETLVQVDNCVVDVPAPTSSASSSSVVQCVNGGYEYQLTITNAGFGQSGPAPAGGGWTMNDNACLLSNASAQCVTNAVLWRKPSAQSKEAILTNCEDAGNGYVQKALILPPSPLEPICLWERNAAAPVDLMLGHAGTGYPIDMNCNTSVDGPNGSVDKPSSDYSFQNRICVANGPGGICTSDLCLFGKTLNACASSSSSSSTSSLELSCKAAEFDATKGTFAAQGWTQQIMANGTITGPLQDGGVSYYRIADNTSTGTPNASVAIPKSVIQDKDFVVEMKARIVSSNTGRTDLTGGNALFLAPDGRYIALYFDTNKFGTIKNLAWAQTVDRNTSDAFHTYVISYKKNGAGVTDDTFDVYFDGVKVMADVKLSDVAYIPSQGSDSLYVGTVSTNGTSTMDVAYVRFSNNASPCVTYTSASAQCVQTNPAYCGAKGCPGGFLAYGNKTYLRYDTAAGSWDSARAHCQSLGGDLVSINDAGEQSAVYGGLVGTDHHDIWIGLSDTAAEGTFKWVDGTTPTYTNWQPGNPDDGYFNEDCVELNYKDHAQTGKWNDFRCSDGYGENTGFICELPVNCGSSVSSASTACGLSEFYASEGTFEQQGWTSVADSDANTNLTGPVTENGVSYVRLTDQSTAQGMRTSDTRITDSMLTDRDWTLEMKSRTVLSDSNGYVLGMNMLLVTPSNVSTSLFIEPSKFGLQAATPNAYTWGPSVSRNTSDAFHTYVIKNKKNAAGASDDTIDVYFDGTKVLSDIPRSQLYVYDAGNGVQGISFGIGSSPGKGTMDVSYVRFKNDEATCPANPFKNVAVQCVDGQDNDGDGKIDYATETEVLVKTWGPVSISPGGASVVAATGLQAGQFIKPTLATGGAVCESILRGNSAGSYYFAGVFTNDAGTYVQASPPNAPASRSIPLVSDPAWPLDIFKVPNGATQLKVFMPTGISFTGTCTLSGKVFDMQRSSNWPGDPDCTSATDDSEAGLTCTDSDGGNNLLQKGFLNATGGAITTGADTCNADGTVREYFCDMDMTARSTTGSCEPGFACVDGACKAGSSSSAGSANSARVGFGGLAFDGNDIIFMPLKNGDMSYHGNVLSFGPVCKPGECGDGVPTSDEQCDDGNTNDGDGCSAKCIWEPYAVTAASSSRSSSSVSSSSRSSSQSSSSFSAGCGDSIITPPEKCDDGNKIGGDGCSAFCQIETGWQCTPRLP